MLGFLNRGNDEPAVLSAETKKQVDTCKRLIEVTKEQMKKSDVHTNLTFSLQLRDSITALEKALSKVEKGGEDAKCITQMNHAFLSLKTVSENILSYKFEEEEKMTSEKTVEKKTVAETSEKLCFASDYMEVCHENILNKLMEISLHKNPGYGSDAYTESAREKIRQACECPNADVVFLVGGTQTNQFVIDTTLAPYEGVVAAESGHVALHEAGAIEFTGHKVMTIPQHLGKMDADELLAFLKVFWEDENHDHMVHPGMVYISHPTEYGTLYTKEELTKISEVCHRFNLPLYLDGARLGYGLTSEETDVTLADLAKLCDTFYIGGTKVGAMFGEAIVYTKNNKPSHCVTHVKQHGALLAKGWLLGLQFDVLFTDNLYMKLGKNAISTAMQLKKGLKEKGYPFYIDSSTNQQFIIVTNEQLEEISKKIEYSFWEQMDENHVVIRLATSWATTADQVDALLALL